MPTANKETYRANISGLQNSSGNIANASSGGTNPAICVISQWIVLDDGTLYTAASQASPYGAAGDSSEIFDWTQDQTLNYTGQLIVSSDTLTLRGYLIEILNP